MKVRTFTPIQGTCALCETRGNVLMCVDGPRGVLLCPTCIVEAFNVASHALRRIDGSWTPESRAAAKWPAGLEPRSSP